VSLLTTGKWSVRASWITGWVSVLGWIAATATPAFLGATLLQGLFVLNDPTYSYEQWHGTLLYFAVIALAILVNIFLIRFLPYLETIILILHIGLFFALLVPLVYLAPQHSTAFVFTDFESRGGWESKGIAWCVGLLTTAFPFTGYDGACHMSEEIEHAELVVPRALIASVALNGALGFGFLIALLFSMGDVQGALDTPTGYPLIEIFYQATKSKRATNAMICGIVASAVAAVFGLMASASRTTFAFSRDNGLPFSRWLKHVNQRRAIPINSILVTTIFLLCLGLINIWNTNAFLAIAGVATVALYFTYLMPVTLLLIRRLRGDEIRFGPWKLGRWGLAINLFSVCYTIFTSLFMFFPASIPVTLNNFNWTSVVFAATLAISGVSWLAFGRKSFAGPIRETL
jgi:choline transport protein